MVKHTVDMVAARRIMREWQEPRNVTTAGLSAVVSTMADRRPEKSKKSLKERAEAAIQGVLDAVGSLIAPAPQLVPIPVRSRQPRHGRRY